MKEEVRKEKEQVRKEKEKERKHKEEEMKKEVERAEAAREAVPVRNSPTCAVNGPVVPVARAMPCERV